MNPVLLVVCVAAMALWSPSHAQSLMWRVKQSASKSATEAIAVDHSLEPKYVYVAGVASIRALYANNGTTAWQHTVKWTQQHQREASNPVLYKDTVMYAALGELFALDAATGRLMWSWAPPALFSGGYLETTIRVVEHGSGAHAVYTFPGNYTSETFAVAVNIATGRAAWRVRVSGTASVSAPTIYRGSERTEVILALAGVGLLSLDALTGEQLWEQKLAVAGYLAAASTSDGSVFLTLAKTPKRGHGVPPCHDDYAVGAFHLQRRALIWQTPWVYSCSGFGGLAHLDNAVIVAHGHEIHALNGMTGAPLWDKKGVRVGGMQVFDSLIYIAITGEFDDKSSIIGVAPQTGAERAVIPVHTEYANNIACFVIGAANRLFVIGHYYMSAYWM